LHDASRGGECALHIAGARLRNDDASQALALARRILDASCGGQCTRVVVTRAPGVDHRGEHGVTLARVADPIGSGFRPRKLACLHKRQCDVVPRPGRERVVVDVAGRFGREQKKWHGCIAVTDSHLGFGDLGKRLCAMEGIVDFLGCGNGLQERLPSQTGSLTLRRLRGGGERPDQYQQPQRGVHTPP
jgi:hypothetical protein